MCLVASVALVACCGCSQSELYLALVSTLHQFVCTCVENPFTKLHGLNLFPLTTSPPLSLSMARLQHDLDELREKCIRLEAQMLTKMSEIDHLQRANQQARDEMVHLKKVHNRCVNRITK